MIVEAAPPIKANKIYYYRDRTFTKLIRPTLIRPRLQNGIVEPPRMPVSPVNLTNDEIDAVLDYSAKPPLD